MSTLSRLIGTSAVAGLGIVPAVGVAPAHAAPTPAAITSACRETESVIHSWKTYSWLTIVGTLDARAKGGACITPTTITLKGWHRIGGSTAADVGQVALRVLTGASKNLVAASMKVEIYNPATGKVLRSASWSSTDLLPKLRKGITPYKWLGATKTVTFATPLPAGSYGVDVTFTADFNDDGSGPRTREVSFSYAAA